MLCRLPGSHRLISRELTLLCFDQGKDVRIVSKSGKCSRNYHQLSRRQHRISIFVDIAHGIAFLYQLSMIQSSQNHCPYLAKFFPVQYFFPSCAAYCFQVIHEHVQIFGKTYFFSFSKSKVCFPSANRALSDFDILTQLFLQGLFINLQPLIYLFIKVGRLVNFKYARDNFLASYVFSKLSFNCICAE